MIKINNDKNSSLKGIVYFNEDIVGVCQSAEDLLDLQCQIKEANAEGYRMEVEIETEPNIKKVYVYKFAKDGKMIPSSYPNVRLWTDNLNNKLLYLYNFTISYNFNNGR